MSHHSDFSLVVLGASEIKTDFGEQLATLLIGNQQLFENTVKIEKKKTRGYTRSDWFKWTAGDLVEKTPYHSLQFLSEQVCTRLILKNNDGETLNENYLDSLEEDDEEREYIVALYYTVISPNNNVEKVLADLNNLLIWCGDNIPLLSDVLEEDENDVKLALENAQFYDRLNDCHYGDEGQGANFFFCALKSIQTLLTYAQTHGLYAIYENENYTSWDWLKKHYPHFVSFTSPTSHA